MREIFTLLLRAFLAVIIAVILLTGLSLLIPPTYNTTSYSYIPATTMPTVRTVAPHAPLSHTDATTSKSSATASSTLPTVTPHTNKIPTTTTPPTSSSTSIIKKPTANTPTQHPSQNKISLTTTLYTTPPLSFDKIHTETIPAIVNILCGSPVGSPLSGITGSGVIIDKRGVILTNAHVAQYVLLQQNANWPTQCVVRTGAPAKARYTVSVLTISTAWIQEYATKITVKSLKDTGENDWGLLYITGRTDGSARKQIYPFVPIEAREAAAITGDRVLVSSYPAGFLGSAIIRKDLWPVSTVITIKKVYTFTHYIIDLLSLGGNIVAQGGASGGAVINQWGKLVGIIATSSSGSTTSKRDLRAITLSHINRSIETQTGKSLDAFLQEGNFKARVALFKKNTAPRLLKEYKL